LGARTRIDHLEEGEMADEVKEGKAYDEGAENVTQHRQPAVRNPIQHDAKTQSTPVSHIVRTAANPDLGDAGRQGSSEVQTRLEVHVQVDVTRRMSRVQLMEDWLSGL